MYFSEYGVLWCVCMCVCIYIYIYIFGDCQILGLTNNQSLSLLDPSRDKALYHLSTRFLVLQYDLFPKNITKFFP